MRPASTPVGLTGRRRDSGEDKVEAIWRRAFDPDTLIPLDQYATSSTFEDPSDRRNAKEKYNGGIFTWPSVVNNVCSCPI